MNHANGMSDEELEEALRRLGVIVRNYSAPELERTDDGRLRLTICTSFSYDPGYSLYSVGEGNTLEECVADLHTQED